MAPDPFETPDGFMGAARHGDSRGMFLTSLTMEGMTGVSARAHAMVTIARRATGDGVNAKRGRVILSSGGRGRSVRLELDRALLRRALEMLDEAEAEEANRGA